jgi:ribosome biogenesis GTPase / thiamine phosphate phosphatase
MQLRDDTLEAYGWNESFAKAAECFLEEGLVPARVLQARRSAWTVIARENAGLKEMDALAAGHLLYDAASQADLPATGDWVLIRRSPSGPAIIHAVLPRSSRFSRKAPGDVEHDRIDEQVIAANVDYAFIVGAAGKDWNPRRLERYIALVRESGALPVIIITKIDLSDAPETLVREGEEAAPGAPILAVSARTGAGLAALDPFLAPGRTAVLLGSSGAGKSTLLNALAKNELQRVQEVREDDERGRHTTTTRTLFRLPSGALVIDTPGLREIQLWADADTVDSSFPDVETYAASCRFRDCTHESEPGCAVRKAVEEGLLPEERVASWRKLRREVDYLQRRGDPVAAAAERERWKNISKQVKGLERGMKGFR